MGNPVDRLLNCSYSFAGYGIGLVQRAAQTGIPRKQRIGVAISGSQKTLMIGLKIALDCGVSIVPMVAFHVGQLLIDTLIADRWRKHSPPE